MVTSRNPVTSSVHLWILHGAFLMSVVVNGLVAFVIRSTRSTPDPVVGPESILSMVLLGFGLLAVAAGVMITRLMPEPDSGPGGSPGAAAFLSATVRRLVLSDVFLEVPAILGFLNTMLGADLWVSVALFALSLGGLGLMIPRLSGWTAEFDRLRRAEPATPGR